VGLWELEQTKRIIAVAAVGQINFHGTWARDCDLILIHRPSTAQYKFQVGGKGNVDRMCPDETPNLPPVILID
jgi:hypothetical protein